MTMITIVVGRDGKIYNLLKGEHPAIHTKELIITNPESLPKNAFVCTEEEYKQMIKGK